MKRRALFLDKDGVINVDHGHVCTRHGTQFIDGIFDLCRSAKRHGWLTAVITNQAAIGRGHCSEHAFAEYMDWVRHTFSAHDAPLDAVYYCPHHPLHGRGRYKRDCTCRKPQPGMLLDAQREWDLDMSMSLLLGDSDSDMEAGAAAGVGTRLLVRTAIDAPTGRTAFAADFLRQVDALLHAQPVAIADHG